MTPETKMVSRRVQKTDDYKTVGKTTTRPEMARELTSCCVNCSANGTKCAETYSEFGV